MKKRFIPCSGKAGCAGRGVLTHPKTFGKTTATEQAYNTMSQMRPDLSRATGNAMLGSGVHPYRLIPGDKMKPTAVSKFFQPMNQQVAGNRVFAGGYGADAPNAYRDLHNEERERGEMGMEDQLGSASNESHQTTRRRVVSDYAQQAMTEGIERHMGGQHVDEEKRPGDGMVYDESGEFVDMVQRRDEEINQELKQHIEEYLNDDSDGSTERFDEKMRFLINSGNDDEQKKKRELAWRTVEDPSMKNRLREHHNSMKHKAEIGFFRSNLEADMKHFQKYMDGEAEMRRKLSDADLTEYYINMDSIQQSIRETEEKIAELTGTPVVARTPAKSFGVTFAPGPAPPARSTADRRTSAGTGDGAGVSIINFGDGAGASAGAGAGAGLRNFGALRSRRRPSTPRGPNVREAVNELESMAGTPETSAAAKEEAEGSGNNVTVKKKRGKGRGRGAIHLRGGRGKRRGGGGGGRGGPQGSI